MKDAKDFWNRLSNGYDAQVNSIYVQAYKKTVEFTKKYLKDSDKVLDYACGTGITTVELANNVKKIHAIDISKNMINIAKNKSEQKGIENIEFEVADIYNEKLEENTFDVVMAFNILYFIKDIDSVINRINKLLKSNGMFISVTDCHGERKTFMSVVQSLLSKMGVIPYMRKFKIAELEEIVEAGGFSIIEAHNLFTTPPNYYIVARKNE